MRNCQQWRQFESSALSQHVMTDEDCGETVTIQYCGVSVDGMIVDKCTGCDTSSIDVSRHLFLASLPI